MTKFGRLACHILNANHKLIARATKVGSLYHLDCPELINLADKPAREDIWHRRFSHLGTRNLHKLENNKMVDGFDYNATKKSDFVTPVYRENITETSFQATKVRELESHLVSFIATYAEK